MIWKCSNSIVVVLIILALFNHETWSKLQSDPADSNLLVFLAYCESVFCRFRLLPILLVIIWTCKSYTNNTLTRVCHQLLLSVRQSRTAERRSYSLTAISTALRQPIHYANLGYFLKPALSTSAQNKTSLSMDLLYLPSPRNTILWKYTYLSRYFPHNECRYNVTYKFIIITKDIEKVFIGSHLE